MAAGGVGGKANLEWLMHVAHHILDRLHSGVAKILWTHGSTHVRPQEHIVIIQSRGIHVVKLKFKGKSVPVVQFPLALDFTGVDREFRG